MNRFLVIATLFAGACAAPSEYALAGAPAIGYANQAIGYAAQPIGYAQQAIVAQPAAAVVNTAHVAESYHAGAPIVRQHVQHGVVGHQAVQVGVQAKQVGHQYRVAGQEVHQPASYQYVAGAPRTVESTVAIAPPALPVAAPAPLNIPPPTPYLGPAAADTVTQTRVAAPVRTHTRITPVSTRIEPELQVNQVPYDVPVHVPIPVERRVVVEKQVARPYTVEVPHPVPVAVPHKVHPVIERVETPVINEHIHTHHSPAVAVAAGYSHTGHY